MGLYLTARAGYDVRGAADFWRAFAADFSAADFVQLTHPGSRSRIAQETAARDEILRKQAAGVALLPEPARRDAPR